MTFPPDSTSQPSQPQRWTPDRTGYVQPASDQPAQGQQPWTQSFPAQQPPPQPVSDQDPRAVKWFLIAGAGLLVMLLVWTGAWFTYQKVFTDTPTEVTEQYIEAARKGDRTAVVDLVCASERSKALKSDDYVDDDSSTVDIVEWKVVRETKGDRTAQVETFASIRTAGRIRTVTATVTLVKEDNDWRICGVRAG